MSAPTQTTTESYTSTPTSQSYSSTTSYGTVPPASYSGPHFTGPDPNYTMTTTNPDGSVVTTTQATNAPAKNKAYAIGKTIQQKSSAGYVKVKGVASQMKTKITTKRGTKSAPTHADTTTTTTYATSSTLSSTGPASYTTAPAPIYSEPISSAPISSVPPATTATHFEKVETFNEPAAQPIGSATY